MKPVWKGARPRYHLPYRGTLLALELARKAGRPDELIKITGLNEPGGNRLASYYASRGRGFLRAAGAIPVVMPGGTV
jgi:hypothetical protein